MSPFAINYYLFISFAGLIILLFLALMSALNLESLRLKKESYNNSAFNLLIASLVNIDSIKFIDVRRISGIPND